MTIITAVLAVVVPTTVMLAIGVDLLFVITAISGRPRRLKRPDRP
jgi:hypothetical protein